MTHAFENRIKTAPARWLIARRLMRQSILIGLMTLPLYVQAAEPVSKPVSVAAQADPNPGMAQTDPAQPVAAGSTNAGPTGFTPDESFPPPPPEKTEQELAAEEAARLQSLIPKNRDLPPELVQLQENEKERKTQLDKDDKRRQKIQQRLARLDTLKQGIDDRKTALSERQEKLTKRLEAVQLKLELANETRPKKREKLQGRLEKLNKSMAKIDERIGILEARIETKQTKMDDLHDKLTRLISGEDVPDDPEPANPADIIQPPANSPSSAETVLTPSPVT